MSSEREYEHLSNESCGKCAYVMNFVCTKYGVWPFKLGKGPFRCKQCVSDCGKGADWDTDEGRAVIQARFDQLNRGMDDAENAD
jgi:hypothetical protein